MSRIRYNERAWAMDLASKANIFINNHLLLISRVSGEGGLRVGQSTLFPDLLIHDNEDNIILGVELKFPDTQPDDNELIINMCAKAVSLGLENQLVKILILYKLGIIFLESPLKYFYII